MLLLKKWRRKTKNDLFQVQSRQLKLLPPLGKSNTSIITKFQISTCIYDRITAKKLPKIKIPKKLKKRSKVSAIIPLESKSKKKVSCDFLIKSFF